ncbi:hypothetical protein MRX96_021203 [Rhipicephalus microplus]
MTPRHLSRLAQPPSAHAHRRLDKCAVNDGPVLIERVAFAGRNTHDLTGTHHPDQAHSGYTTSEIANEEALTWDAPASLAVHARSHWN